MFYKQLQYLKFLFSATNQHGVHSPFVYTLVTTCFYKKTAKSAFKNYQNLTKEDPKHRLSSKKVKLLIRLTRYFSPEKITVIGENSSIKNAFTSGCNATFISEKELKKNQVTCVYLNLSEDKILEKFEHLLTATKNNSFFILDEIYQNNAHKIAWQTIQNHPKVTVTIDVFYFGIVFLRKEQAKEHFKIRV